MTVRIHFDCETQDPDDMMTLAILATHPDVELVGVTTMPGTPAQVGLVKHILELLGNKAPVGGGDSNSKAVSEFHYKWLGKIKEADSWIPNEEVLITSSESGAILLTGAPLKNLMELSETADSLTFSKWVAQGGFAGDSVVPKRFRLPKFDGKETCPTFNFNGAPQAALNMIDLFRNPIQLVSKNVCHGVTWDSAFHERVKAVKNRTAGLELVLKGMELYLKKNPEGKKLHDPLAMSVAIDPTVCRFYKVQPYRDKSGEWGSKLALVGNCEISISMDSEKFFQVLTQGESESMWDRL